MAKEVTNAVKFRDPIQPDFGPDKYTLLFACDDGSVYEFQKMEDEPIWNLRTRGDLDEEPRHWTTRSAPLPKDVEEHLDEIAGESRWRK